MPCRRRSEEEKALAHGQPSTAFNPAVIIVVLATLVFLYLIRRILLPFVVAGIVAFIASPLLDRLARRTRYPRWIWAIAFLLLLVALTAVAIYFGGPALIGELMPIVSDVQGTVERLIQTLLGDRNLQFGGHQLDAQQISTAVMRALEQWATSEGGAVSALTWTTAGAFGFILSWVLAAYFLLDGERIAAGLVWLVPPARRPVVRRIWAALEPVLRRYFVGIGVVVAFTSIAAYVGLGLILGIHYAVFLALLTGVLEAIPVAGPAASAIIAGLVAVGQSTSAASILAYVLYAIALRVSIDQMIGPLVLGRAGSVRPVVVIFCFLAGGILFGVVGVVLATPVALALKITLEELYRA